MKSGVFLKTWHGEPLPRPISGRCAACGVRIEAAKGFCIYETPGDGPKERYVYILCATCTPLMEAGDEDTIESVELRCSASIGWARA